MARKNEEATSCSSSGSATKCPQCGVVAEGIRCPRCYTMKLRGCSGGCGGCGSKQHG